MNEERNRILQETLSLGLPPSQAVGVRGSDTTKETLDKRVSVSRIQTREGSSSWEAASSRSESKQGERRSELLSAARSMFPTRRKLYSIDVYGRRHEIETKELSEAAYQSLLEAYKNSIRYDGPPPEGGGEVSPEAPGEVPEGCKVGPLTRLPMPEWWELPETSASGEETQAAIRRNLERASKNQRGIFRSSR